MSTMSDPARRVAAITPNDATELIGVRSLKVGGAGNLVIRCKDDLNSVTIICVAGDLVPVRAQYVMAASTATNIVALY